MNKIEFRVNAPESGLTLIQLLADRLAVSRNTAKGIIDRRLVFVNGRRTWMARHRLRPGDIVTGCLGSEKKLSPPPRAPFIYEDHDYLIIDKPPHTLSNGPDSIEFFLKKTEGRGEWAACHRLDKDTSGCLIIAKRPEAKERIIALFARNQIMKKYEAVVQGRLPAKAVTITRPIDGQRAVTHVRLLDATPAASHVSLAIETGRTHQIRKHLASIGCPVLGDQNYGANRVLAPRERSIPRQMLHAVEIKFIQPLTGRPVHGRAPLPADMRTCLRQYGLK